MDKRHIAFVWQGITGRYGVWNDGLRLAMRLIGDRHEVTYHEPSDEIPADAIVLYWEAPCTIQGKDSENYRRVRNLPNRKALLFAGGPIQREWLDGFDHVFYESKINGDELRALGVPCSLAFGINDEIMRPIPSEKLYAGIHHGTCASWKRQWLVAEALGDRAVVVGRYQETDPRPFDDCKRLGTLVLPEHEPAGVAKLLSQSEACVQTSDYWGGGQRCTLEAMACGIPVVCMSDSPKNREYVEESGFGAVCEPNAEDIRRAVESVRGMDPQIGVDYVKSKWTGRHYANALLEWIER